MRLKYFLIILLLIICLLPIRANDILINTKETRDIRSVIKNSLELNLNASGKLKLSNPKDVEKLASDFTHFLPQRVKN